MPRNATVTPVDIFQSLTKKEKAKVLKMLRDSEETPCERLGHKYKSIRIAGGFLCPVTIIFHCERCGKQSKAYA